MKGLGAVEDAFLTWQPRRAAGTHDRLNIHPSAILPQDRYEHSGRWLAVHQVLTATDGDRTVVFVELVRGAIETALIPAGTMGVTVYRPHESA